MSTPVLARVAPDAVDYPSSDGKPMAESDIQRIAMIYAIDALETWFAEREDVYVSGDLLIYYDEGNPGASIAPDVFVVFGAAKGRRMTYLLWEEGKAPDFVLEVASRSTWREDEGRKREVYERLGVREYYQYDPMGEYLGTELKGSRLSGGRYEAQPATRSADGGLTLSSAVLGLKLRAKRGGELRFHDTATGAHLLSHREEHARAERESARAERESAALRAAQARIVELERLIRKQRG